MSRLLLPALAALLAACSQPAQTGAPTTPAPAPSVTACNDVTPDQSKLVQIESGAAAVASLPPELPGGPVSPGFYDLRRAQAVDGAPDWEAAHYAALDVSEGSDGVTFNWADARAGAAPARWTGGFHQGPPAQLEFSCGRTGVAPIMLSGTATELRLRLPAATGAGGYLMTLDRRS